MIHLRLGRPAHTDVTTFAPAIRAQPTARPTRIDPIYEQPTSKEVMSSPETNVQPPDMTLQPPPDDDVNPATIDPATGLPWGAQPPPPPQDPNIDPATGVVIMPPIKTGTVRKPAGPQPPLVGYDCSTGVCVGVGLTDLQFHTLQDLTNKGNQHARDLTGGVYLGPSIAINGIIDMNTVNALAALSASGIAPTVSFYDVHLTPQFVADNVQYIIDGLNKFLGTYVDPNLVKMTWNPPKTYECTDGSIVNDPALCPSPIPNSPPSGSSPPIVDPSQIPTDNPITFVPQAQVVGLSKKGAIGLGIIALIVGGLVLPRLFQRT